jgi:hypothetical protein
MEVVDSAGGDEPLVWKRWLECQGKFSVSFFARNEQGSN